MDIRLLDLINQDLAAELQEPLTQENCSITAPIAAPRPESGRNSRVTVSGAAQFHYYYNRLNVGSKLKPTITADANDTLDAVIANANSSPTAILPLDYTRTINAAGEVSVTSDSAVWHGSAGVTVNRVSRTPYDDLVFAADPLVLVRAAATMPDAEGKLLYQPQYGVIQRHKTDVYSVYYSSKNPTYATVETRLSTPIVKGAGTSLSTAAINPYVQPVRLPNLALCCNTGATLMATTDYFTVVHWLKFNELDLTKEHIIDIGDDVDITLQLDPANKRIFYYGGPGAKIAVGGATIPAVGGTDPFLLAIEYYFDTVAGSWEFKVRVNGAVIGTVTVPRIDNVTQSRLYYSLASDFDDGLAYVYDYLMLFDRKLTDDEHMAFFNEGSTVVKALTYSEYILSLRPSILLRADQTVTEAGQSIEDESNYRNYIFNGGLQYTVNLFSKIAGGANATKSAIAPAIAKDATKGIVSETAQGVQGAEAPRITLNCATPILAGTSNAYTYAAWVKLHNTPVTYFYLGSDFDRYLYFNHTNGSMMWWNNFTHNFDEEAWPILAGLNNGDPFLLIITMEYDQANTNWMLKFNINGVDGGLLGVSDNAPGGKTSLPFIYSAYEYDQTDSSITTDYVTIYERLLTSEEKLELYTRGNIS